MQNYLYNLATDKSRGLIPSCIKSFLYLFSCVYGLIVRVSALIFQLLPSRLNCKVISVGNITLGGTGKTSLVEFIARYLKQQGHKVAILTRGYKRKVRRGESGVGSYENMGDEAYMLKTKLSDVPVIVDADRIKAGNRAIREFGVDTVILDDGFQQWKLNKDLEIVTVDSLNPFGNKHLLPRGILREPLSCLKRADLLVLTKANLNKDINKTKNILTKYNPEALILESVQAPVGFYNIKNPQELLGSHILEGKIVTIFSGIGDPASFESLITGLGIKVGLSFTFRDHHHYTEEDLVEIINASKGKNIDTIITTEKDSVRLYNLRLNPYGLRLLVLRIGLIIKDEQRFYDRLLKLYSV